MSELVGPAVSGIKQRIHESLTGDISFSTFGEFALYGNQGYYRRGRVAFGDPLHFETSASESPAFGIINAEIGIDTYNCLGRPQNFDLVELGPGDGTQAATILGHLALVNEAMYNRTQLTLVEISPALVKRQRQALEGHSNVRWVKGSSAGELPFEDGEVQGMVLSNEFLDAIPADCLIRQKTIKELRIALNAASELVVRTAPLRPELAALPDAKRTFSFSRKPVSLAAHTFMRELGRVMGKGSTALTYDYGWASDFAITIMENFRTFGPDVPESTKKIVPLTKVLHLAGLIDITYGVNFETLQMTGREAGLTTTYFGKQGKFLHQNVFDLAVSDAQRSHPHVSLDRLLVPVTRHKNYHTLMQQKVS